MNLFDQYAETIEQELKSYPLQRLTNEKSTWPTTEKNSFIMERDTALELGGYKKESINLMVSSSNFDFGEEAGVFLIGSQEGLIGKNKHISFGKIVLLKTGAVTEDSAYDYLKSVEFTDMRLHFSEVMVRMSSQEMFTNLRIGKKAMKKGFTIKKMGWSMYHRFSALPQVDEVKVILILGDSPLYKKLLPVAEKVKDMTAALNTLFDGIDFDCQNCKLSEICDEVEGLKKMHQTAGRTQMNL